MYRKSVVLTIGIILLLLSCGSNKKVVETIDNPDYLIGEWVFVRYVYSPVGRYIQEQYEEIISSNLIITEDSIYFENEIEFIESCGNFKWEFTKIPEYGSIDLNRIGEEDIDSFIEIETNCFEDLSPGYLKEDTLISINGGIVTYRVKK